MAVHLQLHSVGPDYIHSGSWSLFLGFEHVTERVVLSKMTPWRSWHLGKKGRRFFFFWSVNSFNPRAVHSPRQQMWKTAIIHLNELCNSLLWSDPCFLPLRSSRRRTRYPTGHPPAVCPGLPCEEWRRWRSCSAKSPCWTAPTTQSMWRWETAGGAVVARKVLTSVTQNNTVRKEKI